MARFTSPCPDCGTENRIHEYNCDYEGTERWRYEKAYIDIISTLLGHASKNDSLDKPPGMTYDALREAVNAILDPGESDESESFQFAAVDGTDASDTAPDRPFPDTWAAIHDDCLGALKRFGRVVEREEMGGLYLTKPDTDSMGIIPLFEPIQTVFEYGPIDGCKDISVYSMVSWCELKDLSWDATVEYIEWWLTETNRWETESWGESSIEQLCEEKRHIHRESIGWGDNPKVAKGKMEASVKTAQLDATDVATTVDRSTFE